VVGGFLLQSEDKSMEKILRGVDNISIWAGKIFGWLIIPLIIIVAYDVIIRKIYKATIWSYDTSLWLYAAVFLMGAAWILQQRAHIRIDVFWQRYPPRAQAIFEMCWYLGLLLSMSMVILIYGGDYARVAFVDKEISIYTPWGPPLWHFKAIAPLAFLLLSLQGIADFIRNLKVAVRGS
jgi:TRAP-type mannitol/chloroaromatic compound transport system permease small subunit